MRFTELTERAYRSLVVLAAAALSALTFGCGGVSTFARARPVRAGTTEVAVEPSLAVATVLRPNDGASVAPYVAVSIRRLIASRMELYTRLHIAGLIVGQKTLLYGSDDVRSRFAVAFASTIGLMELQTSLGSNDAFVIIPKELGVPASMRIGERVEVSLAPRSLWQTWLGFGAGSTGAHGTLLWLGGSAALAVRVSRRMSLIPEAALFGKALNENNVGSGFGGSFLAQAALAVAFEVSP